MTPLSLDAAEIVTLTGVVPSVRRTMAFVVHPDGAVFAWTCTRVMVTDLSVVQVEPVHVEVSAPGRKTFCSARGLLLNDSEAAPPRAIRSEEHTSELQSQFHLVCRLLLEKKK